MKRVLSFLLVMVMTATVMLLVVPPIEVSAATKNGLNTDVNSVSGSEFTQFDDLAKKLDSIFAGNVGLYSNISLTKSVTTKLGTKSVPPGTTLYWKCSTTTCSGQSCFAYAVSAYCTLYDGTHPGLTLNSNHKKIAAASGSTISYNNFVNWGVRDDLPVYVQIGSSSDGTGHSIIVLTYTKDYIIYLDGNGDNKGLIAIRKEPWKNKFDSYTGSNIYARKISYIVQPKDSYYPTHKCTQFEGLGVCKECGQAFNWEKTLDKTVAGTYKVTSDFTPRTNAPYSDATKASTSLKKGDTVDVIGAYENAYTKNNDDKWYKFTYNNGQSEGFVFHTYLSFSKPNALSVQCPAFKPSNNASLPEGQSYEVSGTISSNYPLKTVEAFFDGNKYTTWTASDQKTTSLSIASTVISSKLNFANMSLGAHTIKLKATDIHNQTSTFLTVSFNIVNNPTNNILRINYNANGGTVTGPNYYLSSSMVYLKSSSKPVAGVYQYGVTYTNGLHNDTTFGLVRDGYKFVGWSLTADGSGKIFDQDTPFKTEELIPELVNGSLTITMYAIWEKVGCDHNYQYNSNSTSHWKECTLCGDKQSTSSHTYSTNCDTSCNTCGYARSIEHNYLYQHDDDYHWQECTLCGEKTIAETHTLELIRNDDGNAVVTSEKHWFGCNICQGLVKEEHQYSNACDPTCNTCGYARTAEPHTWGTSYQYNKYYHWNQCTTCGENNSQVEHVFSNDCDTSCNVCDYKRTATHTYDNNCDTDCNICGETRSTSHSYDSSYTYNSDTHWKTCTVCGNKGTATSHSYSNACDSTCNTCKYTRTTTHSWGAYKAGNSLVTNGHARTCTICGEQEPFLPHTPNSEYTYNIYAHWLECSVCNITIPNSDGENSEYHIYTNDCDTTCNTCAYTRATEHTYDNDCDADCNVCGETRTTQHVYDDEDDTTCNVCGETRTLSTTTGPEETTTEPDETTPDPEETTTEPDETTPEPEDISTTGPEETSDDIPANPSTNEEVVLDQKTIITIAVAAAVTISTISIFGTALVMKKKH